MNVKELVAAQPSPFYFTVGTVADLSKATREIMAGTGFRVAGKAVGLELWREAQGVC
ncbi:MAG: hypothetical protein JRI59_05050 [Deltaproteobacteria bacterium]|nr:hypothetical protein [Deltaproteobacteria bacterium]